MLVRRLALATGVLAAFAASQLPEFTQQYRQRLGGAVDELKASLAAFDAESARQSLGRQQGIARLRTNPDPLARDRGDDVEASVERETRLQDQEDAFAKAGPVSQYLVLLAGLDPGIARQAYAAYQPAVPVTTSGAVSAGAGLVGGWAAVHALAWPFRRRGRRREAQVA